MASNQVYANPAGTANGHHVCLLLNTNISSSPAIHSSPLNHFETLNHWIGMFIHSTSSKLGFSPQFSFTVAQTMQQLEIDPTCTYLYGDKQLR